MARLAKVKVNNTDYPIAADFTGTISTNWTGTAAPYTQEVSITGIMPRDSFIIDLVPSATYSTAKNEVKAYGKIYKMAVTAINVLTVYSEEASTVPMTIALRSL